LCNYCNITHEGEIIRKSIIEKIDEYSTKNNLDYEYEMFFKSEPHDIIKVDGWLPISTDRIINFNKINEYIENGLLRRIKHR